MTIYFVFVLSVRTFEVISSYKTLTESCFLFVADFESSYQSAVCNGVQSPFREDLVTSIPIIMDTASSSNITTSDNEGMTLARKAHLNRDGYKKIFSEKKSS